MGGAQMTMACIGVFDGNGLEVKPIDDSPASEATLEDMGKIVSNHHETAKINLLLYHRDWL